MSRNGFSHLLSKFFHRSAHLILNWLCFEQKKKQRYFHTEFSDFRVIFDWVNLKFSPMSSLYIQRAELCLINTCLYSVDKMTVQIFPQSNIDYFISLLLFMKQIFRSSQMLYIFPFDLIFHIFLFFYFHCIVVLNYITVYWDKP